MRLGSNARARLRQLHKPAALIPPRRFGRGTRVPTVSWVFEMKHSVGFQRGSPARPGLGDRRVTTPPPLSPVIDLFFIGVAHSSTISPIVFAISTQVGALLIRTPSSHSTSRGSLHACVLLALTRAHQIGRPVRCRTSWTDRLPSA